MNKYLAAIKLYPDEGLQGIGPLGLEGKSPTEGLGVFNTFISTVIGVMTLIAAIWFIFKLITGAIGILSSGGDKQALESAQKNITTGIVGLVVVILALFIVDLIGRLMGIENITNPANMLIQVITGVANPGSGGGGTPGYGM